MNQQLTILLYSKYSNHCTTLIDLIQRSKVDFSTLQLLCIDNEKVRQRIQKDNKIQVTTVPCILDIFSTGIIDKYDNISAFNWVNSIISKLSPPVLTEQSQATYLPINNKQVIPSQNNKLNKKQSLNSETIKYDIESQSQSQSQSESESESQSQSQSQSQSESESQSQSESDSEKKQIKVKKNKKSKKSIKKILTSIDDLSSEEEDIDNMRRREASRTSRKQQDNQDRFDAQKPVKRIRQDSNNFVIDESLFEDEQPKSHSVNVSRAIKTTKADGESTGNDLMARAQALAKSREKDDKQNRPQGLEDSIKR
jgi:hypothetical protein